ncbi:unnamed protein product [Sphenostylis stenocarpa]|uniref:U3 small nucleolar RNA-associated protein 10 N-terminal domain-containing protein n=1 Tax=Sphenostylis stenocarpa TaxID=92480 RepID=A0AA86SZ59_9FABA|nr:unnamed protein product [Sphenostylis stenocarpa]
MVRNPNNDYLHSFAIRSYKVFCEKRLPTSQKGLSLVLQYCLIPKKPPISILKPTLFSIALEGLEVLIGKDERFRNYKNDLFSHRSKELDRELMGIEQNHQLNVSIYAIHVYNNEDLILCSLPYHNTIPFVLVIQILETRNTKWGFLDGVKASGAPPPRMVIVHCERESGLLLGTVVTVKDDLVKSIFPFVVSGLQPGINGVSYHKAGSLMIIGLLGNKAALSPKLLNSLIRSVAEVARREAIDLTDLFWFRLSLISIINLVQSQNVEVLPTKAVDILKEIRFAFSFNMTSSKLMFTS